MRESEREFLLQFFIESDAIEGIPNDEEALRALLRSRVPASATALPGHLRALLMLHRRATAKNGMPADEALTFAVQRLIVGDQHLRGERKLPISQRGAWRTSNVDLVQVTDAGSSRRRIGLPWQQVPAGMDDWFADARRQYTTCLGMNARDAVLRIAAMHWRFERIHPFADGNGRTGRALAYFQFAQAGMAPFVFTARDRHHAYYPCFEGSTPDLMERYFLSRCPAPTAAL